MTMPPKISDFTILVRDMREAQKTYFATRAPSALNKSKALEKQVDVVLKEIFTKVQPQARLF